MYLPFFVARKETKRQRSWHLVSPERTTRKSEAAELRRYEVARFSSLCEACGKEEPTVCS